MYMLIYTQEQLNEALINGVKEFSEISFYKLKFTDKMIKGLKFIKCNFNECQITKCKLENIYIQSCNIKKSSFNESELEYVKINGTSFEEVDFLKCLVSGLNQYEWNSLSFKLCSFVSFKARSAVEIGNCNFESCDFTDADIKCAEFFSLTIADSNMKNIKIQSSIGGCEFKNTNLENSMLGDMLCGNRFISTNLKYAMLDGSHYITKDRFNDVNLKGCKLWALEPDDTVDLEEVNLCKVDIQTVEWMNANLKRCNLEDANIIEADLSGANLEEANLKNANLEDANLEGANLRNANLEGANLKGTNFNEAILDGVRVLEHDYKYLKDYIDKNKVILK
ncbi:hypothetical protein EXM65_16920 [Clostridium botulinum]|uniref:Pentapeptide repeat-containing protein n=1 Tax=Clostridium botulinum TaxID=1491 RepID=A0A6M0SSA9_CLOBO|nr:hypothetical protein [Clostridium botulinum]